MTYKEQLNDPRWKAKSKEIKLRDDDTCQICGKKRKLNVHHVAYDHERLAWEYSDECLLTLCKDCHTYEHECKKAIATLLVEANLKGMLYMNIYDKIKPVLDL